MTRSADPSARANAAIILAPAGRDALIAAALLEEAGIAAHPAGSIPALVDELAHDVGFVLLTEEALRTADLNALSNWIDAQPEWSDLPFILLTLQGGSIERNPAASRHLDLLGNVTFIERPFHPTTLVSLAQAALRARRRQYEARTRLETIAIGQQRLSVALAAGRLGAWSLDLRGGILEASSQCKANFGRAADDPFSYEDLLASIHPEDWDSVRELLGSALDEGHDYDVEYRCIWPDGSTHWVEVRGRIDSTDLDGPVSLSGVSLDTTERKGAEAALRQSEERFRAAVAAVHGVLWTNSADGQMEGEQPGWAMLTGQSYEQYQGFGWASAVHPDDRQPSVDSWNKAVAMRSRYVFEHRVKRHDGHWGHFAICAIPALNSDGSIREWVGVHTDITLQRASERELAELANSLEERVTAATAELSDSRARLRSIFESSFQFVGEVSPEGRLLDVNNTALAAANCKLDEVVGLAFWDTPWFTATPGLPEQVEHAVERVREGKSFRNEVAVNLPNGERIFDFSMRPVLNAEGRVITIVPEAIDITERRQAEERLLQSQKLETIGQLTGGVAHDFNNLLTPIVSSLETLRVKVGDDETARRWATVGLESAERARVLVDRLLSFARRQTLESKPVDIAALVSGMHDLIERSIGSAIEFKISSAPDLPPAIVDAGQFELSILNLCINARDAMPKGGSIDVSIDLDPLAVPFEGAEEGSYVRISVADTGIGMDSDTTRKAIEPFYTTKAVGQGTGLGLSMVHGLVGQLGGGMAIDSAPGRGTTIRLWLPATSARAVDRGKADEVEPSAPAQGTKLLLVDDEPIVRFVTAELLREAGYDVAEASSGAKARALFADGLRPAMLITDQLMPNVKGTDLAAELQAIQPDLIVLIATGYANLPDMPYASISKPFTTADLIARVGGMLKAGAARLEQPA